MLLLVVSHSYFMILGNVNHTSFASSYDTLAQKVQISVCDPEVALTGGFRLDSIVKFN